MRDETRIEKLLSVLRDKHGVLGCLVIEPSGTVVSTSLPAEVDIEMIAALTTTLFSNEDVTKARISSGKSNQMSLKTDQGILHFYEINNHFFVILADKEQGTALEELIGSIEDQGTD